MSKKINWKKKHYGIPLWIIVYLVIGFFVHFVIGETQYGNPWWYNVLIWPLLFLGL